MKYLARDSQPEGNSPTRSQPKGGSFKKGRERDEGNWDCRLTDSDCWNNICISFESRLLSHCDNMLGVGDMWTHGDACGRG